MADPAGRADLRCRVRLVVAGFWRRGALLLGDRRRVSPRRCGSRCPRTAPACWRCAPRTIDFATTATVSAAMLYIAWTIDPLGTS